MYTDIKSEILVMNKDILEALVYLVKTGKVRKELKLNNYLSNFILRQDKKIIEAFKILNSFYKENKDYISILTVSNTIYLNIKEEEIYLKILNVIENFKEEYGVEYFSNKEEDENKFSISLVSDFENTAILKLIEKDYLNFINDEMSEFETNLFKSKLDSIVRYTLNINLSFREKLLTNVYKLKDVKDFNKLVDDILDLNGNYYEKRKFFNVLLLNNVKFKTKNFKVFKDTFINLKFISRINYFTQRDTFSLLDKFFSKPNDSFLKEFINAKKKGLKVNHLLFLYVEYLIKENPDFDYFIFKINKHLKYSFNKMLKLIPDLKTLKQFFIGLSRLLAYYKYKKTFTVGVRNMENSKIVNDFYTYCIEFDKEDKDSFKNEFKDENAVVNVINFGKLSQIEWEKVLIVMVYRKMFKINLEISGNYKVLKHGTCLDTSLNYENNIHTLVVNELSSPFVLLKNIFGSERGFETIPPRLVTLMKFNRVLQEYETFNFIKLFRNRKHLNNLFNDIKEASKEDLNILLLPETVQDGEIDFLIKINSIFGSKEEYRKVIRRVSSDLVGNVRTLEFVNLNGYDKEDVEILNKAFIKYPNLLSVNTSDLPKVIKNEFNGEIPDFDTLLVELNSLLENKVKYPELIPFYYKFKLTENTFNFYQKLWDKKRECKLIPLIEINLGKYGLKVLDYKDPRNLFVGHYTKCCMINEGLGESALIDSIKSETSCNMVITRNKEVISAGWLWIEKDILVIDSIEGKIDGYQNYYRELFVSFINTIKSADYINEIRIGNTPYGITPNVIEILPNLGNVKPIKRKGYKGYTDAKEQILIWKRGK